MGPECIIKVYSPASDVYAFAMLMVEVWTDGAPPYSDIHSLADVAMRVVTEDARPTVPGAMPVTQDRRMRRMWSRDPSDRPAMSNVVRSLASDGSEKGAHESTGDVSPSSGSASYAPFHEWLVCIFVTYRMQIEVWAFRCLSEDYALSIALAITALRPRRT